jgi:hypothetical protein
LRAHETSAPNDGRELHIIGKIKRREGERHRVLAGRVRTSDKEAFEAVAFEMRDGGWCKRFG